MTASMSDPVSASIAQFGPQIENMRSQLRTQSAAFWTFQERLLEQMERTSRAWFERRHIGTQAALKTADDLCQCATPADAVDALMGWAGSSVERMTHDALDAQAFAAMFAELMLGATHAVLQGPSEAGQSDIMTPTEADPPMVLPRAA